MSLLKCFKIHNVHCTYNNIGNIKKPLYEYLILYITYNRLISLLCLLVIWATSNVPIKSYTLLQYIIIIIVAVVSF